MHGRSLGMCKRCGDLRIVACSQCKGIGSVRNRGILNLGMLDDLYESLGAEAKTDNLVPCTKCRSKGRLLCPECSKINGARKHKVLSYARKCSLVFHIHDCILLFRLWIPSSYVFLFKNLIAIKAHIIYTPSIS